MELILLSALLITANMIMTKIDRLNKKLDEVQNKLDTIHNDDQFTYVEPEHYRREDINFDKYIGDQEDE